MTVPPQTWPCDWAHVEFGGLCPRNVGNSGILEAFAFDVLCNMRLVLHGNGLLHKGYGHGHGTRAKSLADLLYLKTSLVDEASRKTKDL